MANPLSNPEARPPDPQASITNLQRLVKHWRTWEAEYLGLQEGLSELDDDGASETEIRQAAEDCEGELLTKHEIPALIEDHGRLRKPSQILGLLERRIDYVRQNVGTMERRLEGEMERVEKLNAEGEEDYGEGLPLMEIVEELDEEGNVVASSVVKPADSASEVLEMLKKSGVEVGQAREGVEDTETKGIKEDIVMEDSQEKTMAKPGSSIDHDTTEASTKEPLKRKKSVTFAAEPQVNHLPPMEEESAPRKVRFAEDVDISEQIPIADPIIPENESTEDMLLRREMLEYNMKDVGTIVAEMDLDNLDGSDADSNDDYDDEEESEDEFGRTTTQVITESYREKMLEMEKRLNARAIINMGPDFEEPKVSQESTKAKASAGVQQNKANTSIEPTPRAVRFAENLDIQKGPVDKSPESGSSASKALAFRPLKDEIVERSPVETPLSDLGKKKMSRFKASRPDSRSTQSTDRDDIYSGNQGTEARLPKETTSRIHSDIIERASAEDDTVREPDNLDPQLHAAEVRNSYHQMRNQLIQRENGFMGQDMEEYEDESGKPQISRFMAARLAREKREGIQQ